MVNLIIISVNVNETFSRKFQGAFSTLQKICEDSTELDGSDAVQAQQQPLDVLLAKFIQFFAHPVPKIRAYALACVNCYILHRIAALHPHIEDFLRVSQFASISIFQLLVFISVNFFQLSNFSL